MKKELVMFGRMFACGDQTRAMIFLSQMKVPYRFVDISREPAAATRLLTWVGHLSVPTLVVTPPGDLDPVEAPSPLDPTRRIRGQNRGTLITEPNERQLEGFLQQHDLL